MKQNYVIILLHCFFGLIFNGHSFGQSVPKIRIDPSASIGGTVSDYFSHVEYIPLESKKESIFGDIGQMIVSPSSIIIYDNDTRSVLFFSKSGKFIKKLTMKERYTTWISYDWSKHQLMVDNTDNVKGITEVTYYTNEGQFISNTAITSSNRNEYGSIAIEGGFSVRMGSCFREKGEKPDSVQRFLVNIYDGNKLSKSFLPFTHYDNPGACTWGLGGLRSTNIVKDSSIYISTPLDYKLYKISKDTAKLIGQFVLPAKSGFDESMWKNSNERFIDSMRLAMFSSPHKILSVSNVFWSGTDNLIFKLNPAIPSRYQEVDPHNFIYNQRLNRLVALERLSPDSLSFYLPILDRNSYTAISVGLIYDNDFFYTNLSSLQVFASRQANKNKRIKYPLVLRNYFNESNRKSNPVIVKLKIRD